MTMERTQHPSNNSVLGAPKGWDQGELPCGALPITRSVIDGMPCIVSYWRPTAEELALLATGGLVSLCVIGSTMPPVSIIVDV
jgi:hypothetical protein